MERKNQMNVGTFDFLALQGALKKSFENDKKLFVKNLSR